MTAARKTKAAPRRDRLDGFRDPVDEAEQGEDDILPAVLSELDVLDMALETRNALKDLDGPLRYVLDQARDEARQANRALLRCNPYDGDKIRDLQWQVKGFDRLMQWVFQTLIAGKFIEQGKTAEQIESMHQLLREAGQGD